MATRMRGAASGKRRWSRLARAAAVLAATGALGAVSRADITTTGSVGYGDQIYYAVGLDADGTLRIDGGSLLDSGYFAAIGYASGTSGAATVVGAGSTWTALIDFYVGASGTGTLRIEGGASVNTSFGAGYIGQNLGSTGAVTVTGVGSTWSSSTGLYVGYGGSGALTVSDGGLVTASTLFAAPSDLHGNGTVAVKGAILDAAVVFDAAQATSQPIAFGSGGVLRLNLDGTGDLGAGYRGTGTLRIADGLTVTSKNGYLGYNAGANGTVAVSGANSKWAVASALYLGYSGSGTLSITDGATVTAKTFYGSPANLSGNGTLAAKGAVLDSALVFDATHGTTQAIAFGSGGSLNLSVDNTSDIGAGHRATGTLRIADGLAVASANGYLGYLATANGTATVTGASSTWTVKTYLYVGYNGSGTLNVNGGGQVSSAVSIIGTNTGSNGTATVSGATSSWAAGSLAVGYDGAGTLNIQSGGRVTSSSADIGLRGEPGAVTVTGTGSNWTSTSIYVGHWAPAEGTLTVADGGSVTVASLHASPSHLLGNGTITANGAVLDADLVFDASHGLSQTTGFGSGGKLNLTVNGAGDLGAGHRGAGTLRIADGLSVPCANGYLADMEGSSATGTVTGANTAWTISSSLSIGYVGTGVLNIAAGAQVSDTYVHIGESGGSGAISVTGGSTWSTASTLQISRGTLDISGGSRVTDGTAYLGDTTNSTSTATVSGAGSQWVNTGSLIIAEFGSATLTVNSGASVTAKALYASTANLQGNGTITVNGVVLDGAVSIDAAHGLSQTIPFGSGGRLSVNLDGTADLGAGHTGSGSLRIADGRNVTSSTGNIGYGYGSSGSATVHGASWTMTSDLYVGNNGSGTLSIESGGQVSNAEGHIGYGSWSVSAVTVTGLASRWTNSSDLHVGENGRGTLTISAGGQVTCSRGYISSTGSAIVDGAGSTWTSTTSLNLGDRNGGTLTVTNGGVVTTNALYGSCAALSGNGVVTANNAILDADLAFDAAHGPSQSLAFGSGGKLTLNLTSSSTLGVGYNSNGTLRVAGGVTLTSSTGYLGYNANSSGSATVSGAGSTWTNASFYVGYYGNGTLEVDAGGQVNSQGTAYVGYVGSAAGRVTVTGAGSTWSNTSGMYVGQTSGGGVLEIQSGGRVTCATGYIKSTGSVIVNGTGSTWTNTADLYLGDKGGGTLTVSNGGVVTANTLYGSSAGLSGNGVVTVNNAILDADLVIDAAHGPSQSLTFGSGGKLGLNLTSSSTLGVGYNSTGTLRVADGVTVTTSTGYLGYNANSSGAATVSGAGSTWTNASQFYVGYHGNGTLDIEAGGHVNGQGTTYLGRYSGCSGAATVKGTGSTWSSGGYFYIGSSGQGLLNVAERGQVSAPRLYVNNAQSALRLGVSGNGMVVLGTASANGTFTNSGTVYLYADPSLAAGAYTPISPYPGKSITWSGTGTWSAFGGTWNSSTHTFTVAAPTSLGAGAFDPLTTGERLLFTDSSHNNKRVAAAFGTVTGSPDFRADWMTPAELNALSAMGAGSVLSAWDFTTGYTGGEVTLSLDIGHDAANPNIWHLHDGVWSQYTGGNPIYDGNGFLSFTVTEFSGYAVAVPEPSALPLLAAGALGFLRRRRRA